MELYCILSGNFVFKPRVRQDIVDLDILGRSHIKSLPHIQKTTRRYLVEVQFTIPQKVLSPYCFNPLEHSYYPNSHQEPTAASIELNKFSDSCWGWFSTTKRCKLKSSQQRVSHSQSRKAAILMVTI